MPIFNGSEIKLSAAESKLFHSRALNPDRDTLNKRDAFLAEIENTLHVNISEEGVRITVKGTERT